MQTTTILPHLLRKDLRHVRVLFTVWFLLLVAKSATVGSGLSAAPDDLVAQAAYAIIMVALPLLQGLVVIVLVPLLIQDEPLVGTTAFWFTRPISRQQLLASKACFVALFLVVPHVVLEFLVLAANGITTEDILRVVPQQLLGNLGLILFLASFAVLTRTFAKFILWLAVTYSITMAIAVGSQIWAMTANLDSFASSVSNPTLMTSRGIAAGVVSIIGACAVVIHQYLTRRTRASAVILAVTIVSSLCVQTWWNHDFLKQPIQPVAATVIPPESVRLSVDPNFRSEVQESNPRRAVRSVIGVRLDAEDVPPGLQLLFSGVNSTVTFIDGTTLREAVDYSSDGPPRWWPSALSAALGGTPVLNASRPDRTVDASIVTLDASELDRIRYMPAVLDAHVSLQVLKLGVIGTLPLRVGARANEGSHSFEIASVLNDSDACRIIVRERFVNLWPTQRYRSVEEETRPLFLLVNRQRHEAVLADRGTGPEQGIESTLAAASPLINRTLNLRFSGAVPLGMGMSKAAVIDKEWAGGAELVILQPSVLGSIWRTVHATDFVLLRKN